MFGSEMLDDDGESTLFEIDGAPGGLPRSEFEVRLRDYGCDCIVASFDMAAASATDDGFIFTWLGDGDGLLEAGDSFQVSKPGTDVYYDHEIVIWDTWADAEVGSELLPGPPLPLLALALVVGAVVLRRRR
jgi:hypothetical protein